MGTTPPVSIAFPVEKEIGLNDTLVEELKSQNNFEAPEETEKRYRWQNYAFISTTSDLMLGRSYSRTCRRSLSNS